MWVAWNGFPGTRLALIYKLCTKYKIGILDLSKLSRHLQNTKKSIDERGNIINNPLNTINAPKSKPYSMFAYQINVHTLFLWRDNFCRMLLFKRFWRALVTMKTTYSHHRCCRSRLIRTNCLWTIFSITVIFKFIFFLSRFYASRFRQQNYAWLISIRFAVGARCKAICRAVECRLPARQNLDRVEGMLQKTPTIPEWCRCYPNPLSWCLHNHPVSSTIFLLPEPTVTEAVNAFRLGTPERT